VPSEWHEGDNPPDAEREQYSVRQCHDFIVLTDKDPVQGPRDTELGIALQCGKNVSLAGPQTQCFHHHHHVDAYESVEKMMKEFNC
jgi:hypothetical protein